MKALDHMTKSVVSIEPETPVHAIAALMVEKRISGVPVLTSEGKLVGIVSQGDLLHRAEVGTERKRKWWLRVFSGSDELAREFSKAHGLKAQDVMSRKVVSIDPEAELSDVAEVMDRNNLKRLPVVKQDRLVGMITRGDLVRALCQAKPLKSGQKLDDRSIYQALRQRVRTQTWLNAQLINVAVDDGVVQLTGFVESSDQRTALRVLAEETDGVLRVDDNLKVGIPRLSGI